jgi:uncharacterized protein YigE (DUF2233 family)
VRKLSASLLFLLCAALNARADWIEKESVDETSAAPGLIHRHVVMESSATGDAATLELAVFSAKSCKLRLLDNRKGNNLEEAMTETPKCFAGVNGGYFDPNFAPLGLRIVDGKTINPLVRGRLLSGILLCTDQFTNIIRLNEFSRKWKTLAAVESGPFLVDAGRRVPGLEATRRARRTFAVVGRAEQIAVGFCSEVSLAELSEILTHGIGPLKVQRALNLDGGSSSGLWFKRADGSVFSIPEEKTVRDFVGVVAR